MPEEREKRDNERMRGEGLNPKRIEKGAPTPYIYTYKDTYHGETQKIVQCPNEGE